MIDFLDPNTWDAPPDTGRVWLDPANDLFAVVDMIDYAWALQWAWSVTPNSTGRKFYATRSTRLSGRGGPQTKLFLHKEILIRAGEIPPSRKHTIGDHRDGDSLNCRRENLAWATPVQNRANRHGVAALQRVLV
ncbi:HNH endonuclease [Rhodopseudomonas pseudopalustris]|uniref:HNH endonuclease n=1 Tax=Rhodopseudomonas pseudopalustris TaxID=1513892 RepID=A0A1H8WHA3_9BRAD|nr:HNH endonuclease [Rhodopseudomonas pseudopalustris]SEP27016.1 HNH endonuclease [Rhodopseudomonas pseudopalustris]